MRFPIKISKDQVYYTAYKTYVTAKKIQLTDLDVKIFCALLYELYSLRETTAKYEDRMVILFSKKMKDKIISQLNTSYNSFMNSITRLKKEGFIEENNTVNESWAFNLNNGNILITLQVTIE